MRIVIQERDRKLLRELAVMRIVDREQAKLAAGFRSTTRVNHRLLALTKAGLLRRFFLGTTGAGQKALYALSDKGARLVEVPLRGPRRRKDEVLVADLSVTHQLFINQILCVVKYQPIPSANTQFLRWLAFGEPLTSGSSLIPDGYFEIATGQRVLAVFVEVDLGHEASRVWKTKVEAYLHYAVSGNFQNQSRQAGFGVLVVANSEKRVESIRKTVASITEKYFRFTTFENINRSGFWSPIWLRPNGDEAHSLI